MRGKPVGIAPLDAAPTKSVAGSAVSKEAKKLIVKNVMRVPYVLAICPDIILVPQRPDLIRRTHLALLSEIEAETPIDVVRSIDELECTLDQNSSADLRGLSHRIKERLRKIVGEQITCSIGIASNRLLAKTHGLLCIFRDEYPRVVCCPNQFHPLFSFKRVAVLVETATVLRGDFVFGVSISSR